MINLHTHRPGKRGVESRVSAVDGCSQNRFCMRVDDGRIWLDPPPQRISSYLRGICDGYSPSRLCIETDEAIQLTYMLWPTVWRSTLEAEW